MTAGIFLVALFVALCWHQLMLIQSDTTFQWQMSKDIYFALKDIKLVLEEKNLDDRMRASNLFDRLNKIVGDYVEVK